MKQYGDYRDNLGYVFKVANIKKFDKDLIIKIIRSFEELFNLSHLGISYIFTPTRGLEGFISYEMIDFLSIKNDKDALVDFPLKTKLMNYEDLAKSTWAYYIFLYNDFLDVQYYTKEGSLVDKKSIRENLN